MEKEQYWSVIQFLEGKSHSEIKERLDVAYGGSSPSMATIKISLMSFNVVPCMFLMNHAQMPRIQLPRRITWQKSKISYWQTADWRLPVITETVGISKDHVGHILHEILGMSCRGAAFAHLGQQAQPWNQLKSVFDAV